MRKHLAAIWTPVGMFSGRAAARISAWWNYAYDKVDAFGLLLTMFFARRYPLVGLLILLGLVWWAWAWTNDYVRPTTAAERADLIGKVAQITGGAILAYGAYWTARNVLVNREGQITERFTRAIDQLGATDDAGNPRLEIRLGAIYALERIAGDSPARVNAAGEYDGAPLQTSEIRTARLPSVRRCEAGMDCDAALAMRR